MSATASEPLSREISDLTPFRQCVYRTLLQRVPAGRVTTYGQLARAIGCRSARAVGQALKVNPLAPTIPCHRVIRADLTIGGFHGATDANAVRMKSDLLRSEGVSFDQSGRLTEPDRVTALHQTATLR